MKKNVFNLVLLPEEPMLGIQLINASCVVEDDQIKKVIGLELGLLFIKLSWIRIK
tara:strand:+ start:1815 stop:1979 length:165 start_codon:yes stop_codon:yes gene_type:complete